MLKYGIQRGYCKKTDIRRYGVTDIRMDHRKQTYMQPCSFDKIQQACDILHQGGLVAFPTETVYGLGCDATNAEAVTRIYSTKNRPSSNPLIIHVSSVEQVRDLANITPLAENILQAFSPGPLTVILQRKPQCCVTPLACAGLQSIAIRIPSHPVAKHLLNTFGKPICAPSANVSGKISPTSSTHVKKNLGNTIECVLEGGRCEIGLESTIIDMRSDSPLLLRAGSITKDHIERVLHSPIKSKTFTESNDDATIVAPGQLKKHYSPDIPLYMNVKTPKPDQAYLGFGNCGVCHINLSPSGNLAEAGFNLFACLHQLNSPKYKSIGVAPIPNMGIGVALNDKLSRASTTFNNT